VYAFTFCDYICLDLVMTLTFDLLTSKSNQSIYVPKCSKIVNLVESPKPFIKYGVQKIQDARTHREKDRWATWKHGASSTALNSECRDKKHSKTTWRCWKKTNFQTRQVCRERPVMECCWWWSDRCQTLGRHTDHTYRHTCHELWRQSCDHLQQQQCIHCVRTAHSTQQLY